MTLLAVDAGGTHTRVACVSLSGRLLGVGTSASGNPTAVGIEAADNAVAAAIRGALAAAGLPASAVRGGAVCAAGAQTPGRLRAVATAAGLPPKAPFVLVGDAVAAYLSVADEHTGFALVVGTGSIAARVEGTAAVSVSDGAGWLLGDTGSGFWIGHQIARAVLADLDGRGPSTGLTARLMERIAAEGVDSSAPVSSGSGSGSGSGSTGSGNADSNAAASLAWGQGRTNAVSRLLAAVYERPAVELSRFADLAFVESPGDAVAAEIVRTGASAVAATLRTARLGYADAPIAGTGSVLLKGYLAPAIPANELTRELADADLRLSANGLVGAAMLALRCAGRPTGGTVRRSFTAELQHWDDR
ncbi:hypothetical protein ACI1US_01142 [Leucobacter sp. BZR 635]